MRSPTHRPHDFGTENGDFGTENREAPVEHIWNLSGTNADIHRKDLHRSEIIHSSSFVYTHISKAHICGNT